MRQPKEHSPKEHSDAFWEALVRRGVTPEKAAPYVPELSEVEIAAEMVKARRRVASEEKERRDRAALSADPAGLGLHSGLTVVMRQYPRRL